jgi:hypothetical protein
MSKTSQAWWYMSVTPATQEAETGELQSKTGPDKSRLPEKQSKNQKDWSMAQGPEFNPQTQMEAGHQWLMPVILVSHKAEIRRITV